MLSYFGLLIQEILSFCLLIALDRNQTVLQRFKPNSRTHLINEQFNLLNRLQFKDWMSRHRGDKHENCFDRSFNIILLSLWYLLTVNQY